MRPWLWGVPLVILAVVAGIALGMRQAGVPLPWPVARSGAVLRTDLGAEAHLGSPVGGAGEPVSAGSSGSGPAQGEGEVITLAGRRAYLTGSSGVLLVDASDGKELLRQNAEGLEGWWSWQAAGTTFLWLRYYDGTGSRLNRVFRYDAGSDRFEPVAWEDGAAEHAGKLTFVAEGALLQEEAAVDSHHTQTRSWRYTGAGRLQSTAGAYHLTDISWYPDTAEGVLTAYVESIGMRLPDEARRYFLDPDQGDASYRALAGRISAFGRAHVTLGDALSPVKREYPFFLDMEGADPNQNYYYLSLSGSVGLKQAPDGKRFQIESLNYTVMPEPVSRSRAGALVSALPEVMQMPDAARSFRLAHGLTRWTAVFANNGPVYEVDSRSGEISRIERDGRRVRVSN